MDVLKALGGGVVALAFLAMLVAGVVGPAWEGTGERRETFWAVFLPSLALLLAIAFLAGRLIG